MSSSVEASCCFECSISRWSSSVLDPIVPVRLLLRPLLPHDELRDPLPLRLVSRDEVEDLLLQLIAGLPFGLIFGDLSRREECRDAVDGTVCSCGLDLAALDQVHNRAELALGFGTGPEIHPSLATTPTTLKRHPPRGRVCRFVPIVQRFQHPVPLPPSALCPVFG